MTPEGLAYVPASNQSVTIMAGDETVMEIPSRADAPEVAKKYMMKIEELMTGKISFLDLSQDELSTK